MRLRQLPPMAAALPRVASWAPLACAGVAGLAVVGLTGSASGGLVFQLRLSGACVAASAAWVLDDPAAATLASSPTTLVARRAIRVAGAVACVAVWWAAAIVLAGLRADNVAVLSLTRELVALTALSVLGAVGAPRWSGEGLGASAGAFVAIGWFALSFLPRLGGVPLPPDPLRPGNAGRVLAVAAVAVGLALLLSRDPANRRSLHAHRK